MSIDIDVGKIAEDLNNKADLDMNNTVGYLGTSAKEYFSAISMPSDEYIEYTATNGEEYTAPADGYFTIGITGSGAHYAFITNNINGIGNSYQYTDTSNAVHATSCPVKKGDVITLKFNADVHYFRFIYAQGEV